MLALCVAISERCSKATTKKDNFHLRGLGDSNQGGFVVRLFDYEIDCEGRDGDSFCKWVIQAKTVRLALARLAELDQKAVAVRVVRKEIVRLAPGA